LKISRLLLALAIVSLAVACSKTDPESLFSRIVMTQRPAQIQILDTEYAHGPEFNEWHAMFVLKGDQEALEKIIKSKPFEKATERDGGIGAALDLIPKEFPNLNLSKADLSAMEIYWSSEETDSVNRYIFFDHINNRIYYSAQRY
jgi:hypothetical protein